MLALGAGAFSVTREKGVELISGFSANLEELPGAGSDPKTMAWWQDYPEAWDLNRSNQQPPEKAISSYVNWLQKLPGRPVFVAWPATYDFTFVYWYLMYFLNQSPFNWSGLDARSYSMALTQKRWFDVSMHDLPLVNAQNLHPHVAYYDAIHQGRQVCKLIYNNLFR